MLECVVEFIFERTFKMSKLKTLLLSSAVSLAILPTVAHADDIGFYADLGGNFTYSNLDYDGDTNIDYIRSLGVTGGFGMKIDAVTIGADVSSMGLDGAYTALSLAKIGLEYTFGKHNTLYVSLAGGGAFSVADNDVLNTDALKDMQIDPAVALGAGYKIYFDKKDGFYLDLGVRYIKTFPKDTVLDFGYGSKPVVIENKFSTVQGTLKIGYQF